MAVLGLRFLRGLSLVAPSGGHSSSRCAGLSLSRPLLLQSTSSRRAGSVVVVHGPSCSTACGIFPDQGSNPCPLHWQADSQPLHHQGSPTITFLSGDVSVGEAVRTLGREGGAQSARVCSDRGASPTLARLQLLDASAQVLDPAWRSGSGLCPELLTLTLSSFSAFQVLAPTEHELCCLGPIQAPRLSLGLCAQSPLAAGSHRPPRGLGGLHLWV